MYPSYAQWTTDTADGVESISTTFANGSTTLLSIEEMYEQTAAFGINYLPPNSEYPAP